MIWLLDVSALVARLIETHEHHARAVAWWRKGQVAVCPITELGFLRVACAVGLTMTEARGSLSRYLLHEQPLFTPCDWRALDSGITTARKTTDIYLADLAQSKGWRLATLDAGINHAAVDVIPVVGAQP